MTSQKTFFAVVVLEFDDSCYVHAKQYRTLVFNSQFLTKYLASLTNQNARFYSIMRFYPVPYRLVCLWYVTRMQLQLSLSNEYVDVPHVKNNSWKLIRSRFKRSDSITLPYKSKNTKTNKQTNKFPVVIHDGQDGSVLVAQARYPFISFS